MRLFLFGDFLVFMASNENTNNKSNKVSIKNVFIRAGLEFFQKQGGGRELHPKIPALSLYS